ncbi:MAG: cobalamin-binding protein [Betaproteobacteria bacterium]
MASRYPGRIFHGVAIGQPWWRQVGSCAFAVVLALAGWCVQAIAEIRVTDDGGQTLTLARPAQRIISMAPHVTELLFAAGAGERIVGTIRYSDYPPAALRIARIGDSFALDSERVLSLKPDLIVVWLHGNSEGQLDQLRRLGIPVFSSEPRRLADIAVTLRTFGALAGTSATADVAAARFDQRAGALRSRYAGRATVRVFYQISERPLLTINGEHIIDDVIRACGGRNVFAELRTLTPMVSPEAVLAANPEAIVTSGAEAGNATGFATWARLPSLLATQRRNFVLLNSDTISRQSERILDGAQALCEALEGVRARRVSSRR